MNPKRILLLAAAVCLTFACSWVTVQTTNPTPTPPPPPPVIIVPSASPIPILPTLTFTPTPITAVANGDVSCRTGPGENYDLVADLRPGDLATVVGKAAGYWIIQPASAVECWVEAQRVTVTGETAALPERVPPPAPTLGPPAAPAHLALGERKCTSILSTRPPIQIIGYEIEFLLTWEDRSNNEAGFYLYRDFNRVGELPPNTTQMHDTFTIRSGGKSWYYYVVAYNAAGETQSEPLSLGNPCY